MAGRVWSREDRPRADRGRDWLTLGRTQRDRRSISLDGRSSKRQAPQKALANRLRRLEQIEPYR